MGSGCNLPHDRRGVTLSGVRTGLPLPPGGGLVDGGPPTRPVGRQTLGVAISRRGRVPRSAAVSKRLARGPRSVADPYGNSLAEQLGLRCSSSSSAGTARKGDTRRSTTRDQTSTRVRLIDANEAQGNPVCGTGATQNLSRGVSLVVSSATHGLAAADTNNQDR